MSQSIILPNYNLSLLQSQKHFTNNKLKSNKINISTQIIPSQDQNSFEINLVVDSPFGQLQISNNIFVKSKETTSTSSLSSISCEDIECTPSSQLTENNGAIQKFLDIYSNINSSHYIGNSSHKFPEMIEDIEDEEKAKSTAPNSPNQEIYSPNSKNYTTSNSPSLTETILDQFQVENLNTEFLEMEANYQKCENERAKSQTILTQTSTTSLLLLEDDSEIFTNSGDASTTFMRSEKKNSVKNVLKAFGNFIINMKEGQDDEIIEVSSFQSVEDLKKRYLRYNKNQSYNNSLVCKIIQHSQYGIIFKHFINTYALQWLDRSDVGDKASHETFITFCKSACEDYELLNCLKIIKKKHLKLSSC